MVRDAAQCVLPGADLNRPSLDLHGDARRSLGQTVFGEPLCRTLRLVAVRVEMLAEIPAAMRECDSDDGQREVGGRAQRVAGENAQASTVRGQRLVEGNLHREIRNARSSGHEVSNQVG